MKLLPESPCPSCGGAAHSATGHQFTPKTLICAGCARKFFAWVVQHTRPRKGSDFYGAAVKWKT